VGQGSSWSGYCGASRSNPAHRPAGYLHDATLHPTFLYEFLWNRSLAALLVWLGRRRTVQASGRFAHCVTGYSFARIGEELLRVVPARHILGLRLNFYVATLLCLAGLAWFMRIQRPRRRHSRRRRRRNGSAPGNRRCPRLSGCGYSSRPVQRPVGTAALSSSPLVITPQPSSDGQAAPSTGARRDRPFPASAHRGRLARQRSRRRGRLRRKRWIASGMPQRSCTCFELTAIRNLPALRARGSASQVAATEATSGIASAIPTSVSCGGDYRLTSWAAVARPYVAVASRGGRCRSAGRIGAPAAA
jgi:hypothetical protein